VVGARGVTNYFTREPAPGTVAQGGLVEISGLNLGPAAGATTPGTPWPTQLAGVQVEIGGKAAPVYSVAPGQIVAQVPWNANTGLVNVTVTNGSQTSVPAHVTVAALAPSVRTADGSGAGIPWGMVTAQSIALSATGLGPTTPPLADGDVGPTGTPSVPNTAVVAYVGGLPAAVTVAASTTRPGEFDVAITAPAGARPGDPITLVAGGKAANPTVFQSISDPQVQAVALPAGSSTIGTLVDAGLDGNFLVALGARGSDGCYPAVTLDMRSKSFATAGDCLTSAAAALTPAVAPNQSNAVAALAGSPSGGAQTGISSTVEIFSAAAGPLTVRLPSPASALTTTPTAIVATLPGAPPQLASIEPATGQFQTAPAAAAGAGAAPKVDIGGLTDVYAFASLAQGRIAVIAGDDPLKPTQAVFAVVNASGATISSQNFHQGWLPLLNAVAPRTGAAAAAAPPPTEPGLYDTATRLFYVLSRATDLSQDAFLAFSTAGLGGSPGVPHPS